MSAGLWALTILIGTSVILNWFAAAEDLRKVFAFTKIAVITLLIIWFVLLGGFEKRTIWFVLALLFSLAGDVLLLLSSGGFLFGLAAF
ncbi:MAG: lysoplasmalogenase family protein, partial [Chloroflexota bacterium]